MAPGRWWRDTVGIAVLTAAAVSGVATVPLLFGAALLAGRGRDDLALALAVVGIACAGMSMALLWLVRHKVLPTHTATQAEPCA